MAKVITSHEHADMDALASLYAAHLLYPGYEAVLPNQLNRNLRQFLTLYDSELPFVKRRELAQELVTDLIIVDTQSVATLKGMDEGTSIRIIDHHEIEEPLPQGGDHQIEVLGATTTLLMERIHELGLPLTRLGASLLLMGIYEDTGYLSYPTTTARDARASAWLLEADADLDLVSEFLNAPLTNGQRDALSRLISNSQMHAVRGRSICIAPVALEQYVDELSALIHQIMDVYEPEACFLLAEHEGTVQLIARSASDAIDVAEVLRTFGGGGHKKAAAARAEDTTLQEVTQALLERLEERVEPQTLVREIMSTNVHTLDLDMSIGEAAQLMRRYGHEGFPVVERDRLVGVLTRSDVDRALHHRLGDRPVSDILYTGPVFVQPDAPVDEVQRVMLEHGLGQVPVVDGDRFVGIVTRTDLIKLWAPSYHPSQAEEIRLLMEKALPQGLADLLIEAREVANDLGYSLYIVGGFVRDLLLGSPTLDLDMVVEGDAIELARHLAPRLKGRMRSHARFGTAKVILPENGRAPGVPPALDFVTARTEFYERPTVLPEVERSSIKQDLYRRDFTINTLAVCLDRDRYGELLDFYGGQRDIANRRIRVLHNLSFVEDPTRILRAVRFEQRLDFIVEERTAELMDDALELLDHVTGERLRNELYLILREERPERALERLHDLGALAHIHRGLLYSGEISGQFARLRQRFDAWANGNSQAAADGQQAPELWICYLALLTSSMTSEEIESFADRLRISGDDAQFLHEVVRLREALSELDAEAMLPSTIYRRLHPFSREARFVLSVLTDSDLVQERLRLYDRELASVEPHVDGYYLRSLGLPPGPVFREILGKVRDALLDGQIDTVAEEQALVEKLVSSSHGLMRKD